MIRSFLMGVAAGARSMTPLAAVTAAAAESPSPRTPAERLLATPAARRTSEALALGELAGDKMPSAPDRIVAPGLAARILSGAISGAAVAPRGARFAGGAIGAATAVVSGYITFDLRMRALRRFGQPASGLVEDALVIGLARSAAKSPGR